jgi:hypothetical protein
LRLSRGLVWATTLASTAGYLVFLGYLRFWLQLPDAERLSRPNQVVFLLGLMVAGLLAGQSVRQARRLARGIPRAAAPHEEEST